MIRYLTSIICVASLLTSCTTEMQRRLDYALEQSGNNRGELERVLTHFADHPDKLSAAQYLIANMPCHSGHVGAQFDSLDNDLNYLLETCDLYNFDPAVKSRWDSINLNTTPVRHDINVVSADYLIDNIDRAYRRYRDAPWNKNLPFSDFCELILPYRIADERLTDWRGMYEAQFAARLDSLYQGDDVLEAAQILFDILWAEYPFRYYNELNMPHRDALSLHNALIGNCRDYCDRIIYVMRACGIPVTADKLPASPESGKSHQWNVIRDNVTGKFIPFGADNMALQRDSINHDGRSKGKVYRYGYGFNPDRLERMGYDGKTRMPSFADPRFMDVSAEYFGHNIVQVPLSDKVDNAMLAVFARGGLSVIDCGDVSGDKVRFTDIEPGIIYFPVTWHNGVSRPCGMPFIVNGNGLLRIFSPDNEKSVSMTLTRKMPVRWWQKKWNDDNIVGTRLVAASNSTFCDADTLLNLDVPIAGNYGSYDVASDKKYRYFKLISPPDQLFSWAEIKLYSESPTGNAVEYDLVTDLPEIYNPQYLNDDDILTYFVGPEGCHELVFRLSKISQIKRIELIPRNDDNFVWPGQIYELQYLDSDGNWKSQGRKTADGHSIEFSAPDNALMILHNRSKGKEEQVFIYEDGRQKFSIDL